tara:strand:+ start:21364 stop:22356 length:993 start_codon:yes stop_codon:yes gene_type:complete
MAFLDNSGTIIIDAVLTDVGRKQMAQGKFKISKFSLGDDELDYSLVDVDDDDYDKIEALPIMEAFANDGAVINYGLKDYNSDDILYIPEIKVNELLNVSVKKHSAQPDYYYLTVNEETSRKLKSLLGSTEYYLQNNSYSQNKIIFESGIHSDKIPRSQKSRERYILNYNLLDRYFIINCDRRFVEKVMTINTQGSYFENDAANTLFFNFGALTEIAPSSLSKVSEYHNSYITQAIDNLIYSYSVALDRSHSAINGPRGTVSACNFKLINELTVNSNQTTDFRYVKFGMTDQTLFGGSDKFDYIDTVVYIEGISSAARLEVPIRILRYAGT